MAQVYLSQYARRAALADTASYALNVPTAAIALPGGQDTQIQFNSGNLALSGSSNFTYNYASTPQVLSMTGSTILSGSTFLFGIPDNGLPKILVYDNITGNIAYTASSAFGGPGSTPGGPNQSIQYNNSGDFDGDSNFTFNGTNIVTLTGSMLVSGAISASFGPNTVGFFGTASWAVSASQAISASRAVTASFAISSSRAVTASFALTASFATTSSYASSSPNFANTNLEFTDNRKHSTNNYSYFIYSDIVGGNPDNPFDGIGVSGSFYFFNSSSNALGTAAGSTNTYTYIEITTQSIDLSFNADPAVPSVYTFTKNSASFSSSLTVTKSVFFPGLTSASRPNVVMIDTASGQLYYLNSSSLGTGTPISLDIQDDGALVLSNPTILNFTGSGVSASADGTTVDIYIPGGGVGTPGGDNTQIQFNGGGVFSGSSNFTFISSSNIVNLTGSMIVSGAISASFGPNTVGFFGTASWAQSASNALFAQTSSFITASNVWGPFGSSSVASASYASSSTFSVTASFVTASNVWGPFGSSSVYSASYASGSTSASYALTASFASNTAAAPLDTYIQYNKDGILGAEEYFRYIYTSHSFQHGRNTTASGDYSHTEGSSSLATGDWSHAEGKATTSSGAYSHAEGSNTKAIGAGSHAEGLLTNAIGAFSHAEGRSTSASGEYSHAEGFSSKADGDYSRAEGSSWAIGAFSHAEGRFTTASGFYSHAEGFSSEAYGTSSHSEGYQTFASGNYSHAEGYFTTASGIGSHAEGYFTSATGDYQLVVGQYNVASTSQSAFIVGDGTNITRHNILFVSNNIFEVSASNVFLQGLPTSSELNVLVYNTSSGQVYYTASNAIGGGGGGNPAPPTNSIQFNNDGAFGGSEIFTFIPASSSVYLTGSLLIGSSSVLSLYTTAKITTVAGINTIYSLQTASYDGVFFDYTLISGLNARAGQIMSIWSGSQIRYTETTTTDIGSTSEFIFSVALTAGSASLQVTGSTGAVIKTIIKGI